MSNSPFRLKFYHPRHDDKHIPALSLPLLTLCQSIIQTAHTLIIEDLSKNIWLGLIDTFKLYGGNLKHITLEASGELEPFYSSKGILTTISMSSPHLECLRLDGMSGGGDHSTELLVQHCPKLRAITIDYCYGLTMKSFVTLWNGLSDLEFIGFAGIIGPLPDEVSLQPRPKLHTIRFVDCDVSDSLVCFLLLLLQ